MTEQRAIPHVPSLGPLTLFRFGPWEVIVPVWVAAAVAAAAWIASPAARVAFVTDWRFAGAAGAALGAMIGVAAFTRIWWDLRHGLPFVLFMAAAGFAALAVASRTIFAPALVQASSCAPMLAAHMPPVTRVASYVLPLLMLVAWTMYLLSRFPVIATMDHATPGAAESRVGRYARAVRRLLPFRSAALVLAIVATAFFVSKRYAPLPEDAMPAQLVERLRDPSFALLDLDRGGGAFARLAAARAASEQRATVLLQNLELDAAAVAVRECACLWLAPRDRVAANIRDAADGFAELDRDLASQRWRPGAATTAALLKIVPIDDDRWIDRDARIDGPLETTDRDTSYRGETVLRTRRSYARDGATRRLAAVSLQFLGRGASDMALLHAMQRRMGRRPDEGPCVIGNGSLCASWNRDGLHVFVRPAAEDAINDETPLWLTISAIDQRCCERR